MVRIIEVPREIHNRFPNSDRIPLFEYIAKNVGIRRARGEYVLATNPELLYSEDLTEFLASRRLSPDCFCRVDRYDVSAPVALEWDTREQLSFCARHVSKINIQGGTIELVRPPVGLGRMSLPMQMILYRFSHMRRKPRIEDRLHTNASGDFFLMLRDHWHKLRGYLNCPPVLTLIAISVSWLRAQGSAKSCCQAECESITRNTNARLIGEICAERRDPLPATIYGFSILRRCFD